MDNSRVFNRRRFLQGTTAVAGLGALGLLAACGNDDDDTAPVAGEPTATTPPAAATEAPTEEADDEDGEQDPATEEPDDEPTESGELTTPTVIGTTEEWNVVITSETGGADPFSEYPPTAQYYLPWHICEPLFYPALAEDGHSWTLVNELAKDWSFTDPTTLVVEVEEGIFFQNGEELTAEHVKVAFDTMVNADPPTRRTTALRPLGEAEVVDKYTIRWHMPEPNSAILGVIYVMLIPPLARQEMTAEEFEANPIGTGPYRAVSWPRDGIMELEAWDGYRRGKVRPDRIIARPVPDASTRLFELLSGNAQIAHGLTSDMLGEISGNSNLEMASLRGATLQAQVMNIYKSDPPLNNKLLRQAMNHAIDSNAIIETILAGQAVPHPGPLGPGWHGFQAHHGYYDYDPDRARALLAEAGLENVSLTWNISNVVSASKIIEVAQVAANQLEAVGINVTLQQMETARLLAERSEGNYDIVSLGFGVTWLPTTLLHFTTNVSLPDDKLIPIWGETPDVLTQARDLFETAGQSTDLDEMEARLAEMHELMHDEAFWLFIYSNDELFGIDKSTGYRPFPTVYYRYYDEWDRRGMAAPADPNVPLILT